MNNELISRSALKKALNEIFDTVEVVTFDDIIEVIDNAPTVEEEEKTFITECRETAIKENLPLYFIYYEETGVIEIYVTETKELFEKRHCPKHLSDFEFRETATNYLDWYFDWKRSTEVERQTND